MAVVLVLVNSAVVVALALAAFGWSRRPAPGATAFTLLMLAIAQWSFGVALGLVSQDLPTKLFWAKFVFVGIGFVPLCWLVLSAQYTGQTRWLSKRIIAVLAIEPVITNALAWTNEAHGWIYTSTRLVMDDGYPMVDATFGIWTWVHTTYSYVLILAGTVLLLRMIVRLSPVFQAQAWMLLVAAFVPWVSNIFSVFHLSPFPFLDLTPIAFTLSGLAFGWAFFRLRLLEIVPVARDLAIEKMSDGLLVVDQRARVVDVNPAGRAMLGLPARQIIGQSVARVLPAWSAWAGATAHTTEISLAHSASARAYDVRITPLFDHQRRLTGHVAILRDITDYKRVEHELDEARESAEQRTRAYSAFLATASYEFRTPLTTIAGYSSSLMREARARSWTSAAGYLDEINAASRHMLGLVNNLLELTKIEMGVMPLNARIFDVAALARQIGDELRARAEMHDNTLELRVGEVAAMNADRDKVAHILRALLDNACQFTRRGHIVVQLARETVENQDWVVLSVSDTGIGIAPDYLPHLFEPFTQADKTMMRQQGSTGLSLALSQRFCAMMGGAIEVASEVGRGSVFTVRLPLRVEPPNAPSDPRRVWLSD